MRLSYSLAALATVAIADDHAGNAGKASVTYEKEDGTMMKYDVMQTNTMTTAADGTEVNTLTVNVNFGFEMLPYDDELVNYSSSSRTNDAHSGWWVGNGFGYQGMPNDEQFIACHILNAATDEATAANSKCWWSYFNPENYGAAYVLITTGTAITHTATVTKDTENKKVSAMWDVTFTVSDAVDADAYMRWKNFKGSKVGNSFSQGKVNGGRTLSYPSHTMEGNVSRGEKKWSGAVQTVVGATAAVLAAVNLL
mmetsp:Transcript_7743/g.6843  ORF Transcript_7743/g.6843 Transcript_7743/m.6843 type:complete len:253 (+) Transcript_7743:30-788(+)